MKTLEQATRQRLDRWEQVLRGALEQTQVEDEKQRLERELAELGQARTELPSMTRAQQQRLHDHLSRDPAAWLAHAAA